MGKKILLADDSITIQKVIELTFSDEDFDVITVGNGRLALEKLLEVRPDIVLCDIIMPEKDGYEVCEQIKTNPATSHIPVLLLTGAFEPFDQERAARAGYDGSLAKPFEPETLIAKVKDLLARAPARVSAQAAPAVRPAPAMVAPVLPPPVPPPAVLPFQRPAPPAPVPPPFVPPAAAAPRFIPDEPFGGFEDSAFAEPAPTSRPSTDAYAPMTEEESATLLAPPAPEPPPADAASTVMFRAGELPWNAQPAPPAPDSSPRVARETAPGAAPVREPEPVFVPEPPDSPGVIDEPAVFEEVLEEDLDFGSQDFEPAPQVELVPNEASSLPMPADVGTLPPIQPEDEGGATGAFESVSLARPQPMPVTTAAPAPHRPPEPIPVFEPEPAFEPGPVPEFEPEPSPVFEPELPPAFEPEPPPVFQQQPRAAFAREPEQVFEPEPEQIFEPEPEQIFEPEPEQVFEPEPRAAFEPEPERTLEPQPDQTLETELPPIFQPEPGPAFEPEPERVFQTQPAPVFEPARATSEPVPPAPAPFRAVPETPILAPESFADVAAAVIAPEPPPAPQSEAAAVSVPIEMVEKIAQRVVAQISEKAVREIAWEVIPDLAEAMIRREIERLKAELQKI